MPLRVCASLACIVLLTAGSVSCGSTTSVTSPGGGGPGACRVYATKSAIQTTSVGVTLNASQTASFDTSKLTYTVMEQFTNGSTCSTAVSSYNSVGDFVDETSVNPGRMLSTGTTGTNNGQCGSGSGGSSTNSYDSQRRILKVVRSDGSVTTYTAWDSQGRPTSSTDSGGVTITYVYDDNAHTLSTTSTLHGVPTATSLETYDANGNVTSLAVTTAGITTTTTFNNTATAQVCK